MDMHVRAELRRHVRVCVCVRVCEHMCVWGRWPFCGPVCTWTVSSLRTSIFSACRRSSSRAVAWGTGVRSDPSDKDRDKEDDDASDSEEALVSTPTADAANFSLTCQTSQM
jgi:hypothetical protein